MVKPLMGKFGAVGLAPQTAVGSPAPAPTLWLPAKGFMPPVPQLIFTDDEFADGTIFASGSRFQGVQSDTLQMSFMPTLKGLTQLLAWAFGDVVAGTAGNPNTITPRLDNFASLSPGTPLTVWQLHPIRNTLMTDVQISGLSLNVTNRQTVDASISLAVSSRAPLTGTAPTPVLALDDVLQFMHFYAYYNAQKFRPKDATITLEMPMEVQDGAQGEDMTNRIFPVGWERSGAVKATTRITVGAHDPMAPLIASYEDGVPHPFKAGFHIGTGKDLEITMPEARVTTADPNNGLGLIDMPAEFAATYNGGTPTFSFTKVPTLT